MRRSLKLMILVCTLFVVVPVASRALGDSPTLLQSVTQRALRFGDRGDEVLTLQKLLADAGFDPGPLDGKFGPLTQAAVKRSQEHLGIAVDGMAGKQTVTALSGTMADDNEERAPLQPAAAAAEEDVVTSPGGLTLLAAKVTNTDVPAPVSQPVSEPKLFALTFNGKPDPDLTERLLDVLRRNGMQATFFLQGNAAEKSGDVVAKLVADGHEIGNNGADETDPTTLTEASLAAQLSRAQGALERASGKRPVFFRPTEGRFDSKTLRTAQSLGLKTVLWTNVAAKDQPDLDPRTLADRLEQSVYPGAILMLHQDRTNAVEALELLLQELRAEGYQSVGLSKLLDR